MFHGWGQRDSDFGPNYRPIWQRWCGGAVGFLDDASQLDKQFLDGSIFSPMFVFGGYGVCYFQLESIHILFDRKTISAHVAWYLAVLAEAVFSSVTWKTWSLPGSKQTSNERTFVDGPFATLCFSWPMTVRGDVSSVSDLTSTVTGGGEWRTDLKFGDISRLVCFSNVFWVNLLPWPRKERCKRFAGLWALQVCLAHRAVTEMFSPTCGTKPLSSLAAKPLHAIASCTCNTLNLKTLPGKMIIDMVRHQWLACGFMRYFNQVCLPDCNTNFATSNGALGLATFDLHDSYMGVSENGGTPKSSINW